MDVYNRLNIFFLNRLALSSRKEHPIYIIPTANGLKVLALNFLLLVIGLIYANNYVLLFNFLLFCLVLSSMFYTHHNLKFITLKSATSIPGFNQEMAFIDFQLFSTNKQNNYEIKVSVLSNANIECLELKIDQLSANQDNHGLLPLRVHKRGLTIITGIFLETQFPLGFFRCFTFFPQEINLFLYPARIAHNNSQQTFLSTDNKNPNDEDDQLNYRDYQRGDSFNRLDWKRFAKNKQMYILELNPLELDAEIIRVDIEASDPTELVERKLEQATFSLNAAHQAGRRFGLMINNQLLFDLDNSKAHFANCLQFLGSYEH